jgi:uncharacterized spore protein YtfJ
MDIKDNLKAIFDEMENFLTSKAVVGEPIEVGNITLIPVINVTFGMGTGAGGGEDSKSSSRQGRGAGLGAKISPSAVIAIREGDISVIPLNGTGGIERLIDMVPDLVNKIKSMAGSKSNKGRDKNQVRVR